MTWLLGAMERSRRNGGARAAGKRERLFIYYFTSLIGEFDD